MKLICLILISIFCISCSTLHKEPAKKYYKVKAFNLDGSYGERELPYYSSKDEPEHHCFDKADDREIITVPTDHPEFAIGHFYKRTSSINVTRVYGSYSNVARVIATDNVDFELEIAECYFNSRWFIHGGYKPYSSFRLKR